MEKILLKSEEVHLLDYDDIVALLTFKMQELKKAGWSNESIIGYFANEDLEGDLKRIVKLKQNILKQISNTK